MLKQNKYFVAYLNYLVKGGRTRGWKVEPRLKEIQMVSVKTSFFFIQVLKYGCLSGTDWLRASRSDNLGLGLAIGAVFV